MLSPQAKRFIGPLEDPRTQGFPFGKWPDLQRIKTYSGSTLMAYTSECDQIEMRLPIWRRRSRSAERKN
ncbi:hypothetical protein K443DRAFT_686431 [Laccaria amethystina LaAM-08-1]|uniref:Uncharacterized protein n=1 Tax=Laccaria amethystina LaAM-08-1 TaxID=1095629 RepID=A0A0C9WS71_9AGAR|nr:hypothetical protein K443DRAFT_686431 [Laccaria amethystina LaAM-08-1]